MQKISILTVFLGLLLSGCGGPPAANSMLTQAQQAFREAESNPQIVSSAPVALQEAEEELRRSEQIWRDKGGKEDVDHHAYLTMQRIHIAEEMAKLNVAEQDVKRAEVERKEVMLEMRTREAERAEAAAQQARQEADEAIVRARQLAAKLTELEARKTNRGIVLTLNDVLFDTGKADLKANSQEMMVQLGEYLAEYPERTVLVEGFTDSSGSADFNLELSLRRAESVRRALINRGVSSERVRVRGYGSRFPVGSNETPYGRQQNRRVEIVISNEDGVVPDRIN